MKTRRFIAAVLAICLVSSFAFAEQNKGTVITKEDKGNESILDKLEDAWEDAKTWAGETVENTKNWAESTLGDASEAAQNTWNSSSEWIAETWGNASEAVQNTWNNSTEWITDIWGDASTWVSETYDSASGTVGEWVYETSGTVSNWWSEFYKSATEAANNAWWWIGQEAQSFRTTLRENYEDAIVSVQKGVSDAGEKIRSAYEGLLKDLNLNDPDISKVLETVKEYALKIGVPAASVAAVLLPYLVKLIAESVTTGKSIPAIIVAQFLTIVARSLDLDQEGQTEKLIDSLVETLGI